MKIWDRDEVQCKVKKVAPSRVGYKVLDGNEDSIQF